MGPFSPPESGREGSRDGSLPAANNVEVCAVQCFSSIVLARRPGSSSLFGPADIFELVGILRSGEDLGYLYAESGD
jgi:hypothetical protein